MMFDSGDYVVYKGKYSGIVQRFSKELKEYVVLFPRYRRFLDVYINCSVLDLEHEYKQVGLPF